MDLISVDNRPHIGSGRDVTPFATEDCQRGNKKCRSEYLSYHVATLLAESIRRIKRPSSRGPIAGTWCTRVSACERRSQARGPGASSDSNAGAAYCSRG